jgi:hypothetical protein
MVDEKLRKEMTKVYTDGDHKKALRLSRRLDRQILKEVKDKDSNKKTKKKNLDIEI